MITPADWDQSYEIHRGATFNLAHNLSQMLHLRPRNRFEDLEGVYLVGGGTHPGSGLPVIFESARITSRLLVEDLGILWPHLEVRSHADSSSCVEAAPLAESTEGIGLTETGFKEQFRCRTTGRPGSASSAVGWEDWRPRAHSPREGIASSCSSEIVGSGARQRSSKNRAIASTWARPS